MSKRQTLHIWWPSLNVPVPAVWQSLFDNRALLQLPDHFNSSESDTSDESDQWVELLRMAKTSGRWPAFIKYGNTRLHPSCTGVRVESIGITTKSALLDAWLMTFKKLSFIQAWIADTEFAHTQSNTSITHLKLEGAYRANAPHCRATHWIEPYEIDISRNPGREIRRDKYWDAVGSQMWISDDFWKVLGKTKGEFSLDAKYGRVE